MINLTLRTIVFGVAALSTVVCCLLFSEPKTDPKAGVVAWLPNEMLGFEVQEGVMGAEEKKWLPSDTTFLKRTYLNSWVPPQEASLQAINATLIVAGSDSRSLHRPQVCLLAQGWTIERREVVSLRTDGGPLKVMDFHLVQVLRDEKGGPRLRLDGSPVVLRAHYIYWWVGPDASTPSDEKRVWLELWNSILKGRRERWAYPSVMVYVDERDGRQEAQQRAYSFIQKYAPEFQKSLGATDREDALELKSLTES